MKAHSSRLALLAAMCTLFIGVTLPSFAGSEKLSTLTAQDVKALIATAKTPEQHLQIAQYFNQEAQRYESEAKDHQEMIQAYRQNPLPKNLRGPGAIFHCEFLAKSDREMAKTLRDMAAAHEQMAKEAGGK